MSVAPATRVSGPGSGPEGVPAAIGLSPILSARYKPDHLARIANAAPGSRLITVSLEGLADGDLSEVEVLLRGPLPQQIFDRLLSKTADPGTKPAMLEFLDVLAGTHLAGEASGKKYASQRDKIESFIDAEFDEDLLALINRAIDEIG